MVRNSTVPIGTPFSKVFVLQATLKHMRRSIDISIDKSFKRMPEFEGDSVKGVEIMETLSALHALRGMLEEFEKYNPQLFNPEQK